MEFGIFAQLFVPDAEREADPQAEHKRIMKNVEMSVLADRVGFKYVWIPEHHFLDQYSHMPGPEVFGSFVAAQTDQIHIGAAILNVNPKVNHPARLAEKVALMDHLFEGRFEFGTGRGAGSHEVASFNGTSTSDTKDMWDEVAHEIPRMWEE
ncbi:MAG: LLM class flavin-dependent oxidoreductase, partial [Acidimicrobiales bacterium]